MSEVLSKPLVSRVVASCFRASCRVMTAARPGFLFKRRGRTVFIAQLPAALLV